MGHCVTTANATNELSPTEEERNCNGNGKRKIHFRAMPAKQTKLLDLKRLLPEYPERKVEDTYTFERELGIGGFAITYLVIHNESKIPYACKAILKEQLTSQGAMYAMRNEVRVLDHLSGNPNIVNLKDVFEDDEGVYIITNLCYGGELGNPIKRKGKYSEAVAAPIIYNIVKGIQTCHSKGVVHRDLKPENVLFVDKCENANVQLIDFGLSTFFKPGDVFAHVVGTTPYMAPEMLNREYGPEVDIWSVGVILCTLLTGYLPFFGVDDEEIRNDIKSRTIDFTSWEWQHVSPPAKALVRGMLRKNPRWRYYASQILVHPWIRQHRTTESSCH